MTSVCMKHYITLRQDTMKHGKYYTVSYFLLLAAVIVVLTPYSDVSSHFSMA